jgi:hypothetical protein
MRKTIRLRMLLTATIMAAVFATSARAQESDGAFAQLSPYQQRIARALFEAQRPKPGPKAPTPLTLDEIATKRDTHDSWGPVFKEMKKLRLLSYPDLGRVITAYNKRHAQAARMEKAEGASH